MAGCSPSPWRLVFSGFERRVQCPWPSISGLLFPPLPPEKASPRRPKLLPSPWQTGVNPTSPILDLTNIPFKSSFSVSALHMINYLIPCLIIEQTWKTFCFPRLAFAQTLSRLATLLRWVYLEVRKLSLTQRKESFIYLLG